MENMKRTISATIDSNLATWIDKESANSKYRNKSHLIEIALEEYKKKVEKHES